MANNLVHSIFLDRCRLVVEQNSHDGVSSRTKFSVPAYSNTAAITALERKMFYLEAQVDPVALQAIHR